MTLETDTLALRASMDDCAKLAGQQRLRIAELEGDLKAARDRIVHLEWYLSRIAIRTEFFDPGSPPDVIHQDARAALSKGADNER